MVGEYLGFDYGVAYKYHLYFVAFRDKVRWCIKNGIRVYETGALNYDPKKRLDYKFIPQYIYARHRNNLANSFLSALIRMLEPGRRDPVLKSLRSPS
jgi:predicted N-acyltransferase